MSACRYVEGWGYYLKAHELNCRDSTCVGCQPCTHDNGNVVRHCTGRERCTSHLDDSHPRTCPRCVGRTRKHIAEIDVWHERDLLFEAIQAGVDSDAAMLAGPAADPETWRNGAQVVTLLDAADPQHPLTVLGTWAMTIREARGQAKVKRWTVTAAGSDLLGSLTLIAQDERVDWARFSAEVAACHTNLTTVLHIARRTERGAPCPECNEGRPLTKHYRNVDDNGHPDLTGASDYWACPACGANWLEAEYRLRVADDYLENALILPASEIARIYDVPEGTVRYWANEDPPRVRKHGYDGKRRQLYDVADVNRELAKRREIPSGLDPTKETA